MIWNVVMNLYNISKTIILPIIKKLKSQINRNRYELDNLFIIYKYKYLI